MPLATSPLGKPYLPDNPANLTFNVSHAGEIVLIGFGRGREIGVDVEQTTRSVNARDIAVRFFCAAESRELEPLQGSAHDAAFFRCWTRKEAILKASGKGLQTPLKMLENHQRLSNKYLEF